VDGAMMGATEQGQVRQRRGAAFRPVADVVALGEGPPTPREATALVAMMERPAYRGRDGAGAGAHRPPARRRRAA
jgi:hypothetical protein